MTQPAAALAAARAAIPCDVGDVNTLWQLGALSSITSLTGSALIALAVLHGRLSSDAAWEAAHVDEDWNLDQWGHDEQALRQRAFRAAEMQAAATVLNSCNVPRHGHEHSIKSDAADLPGSHSCSICGHVTRRNRLCAKSSSSLQALSP